MTLWKKKVTGWPPDDPPWKNLKKKDLPAKEYDMLDHSISDSINANMYSKELLNRFHQGLITNKSEALDFAKEWDDLLENQIRPLNPIQNISYTLADNSQLNVPIYKEPRMNFGFFTNQPNDYHKMKRVFNKEQGLWDITDENTISEIYNRIPGVWEKITTPFKEADDYLKRIPGPNISIRVLDPVTDKIKNVWKSFSGLFDTSSKSKGLTITDYISGFNTLTKDEQHVFYRNYILNNDSISPDIRNNITNILKENGFVYNTSYNNPITKKNNSTNNRYSSYIYKKPTGNALSKPTIDKLPIIKPEITQPNLYKRSPLPQPKGNREVQNTQNTQVGQKVTPEGRHFIYDKLNRTDKIVYIDDNRIGFEYYIKKLYE